MKNLSKVLLPIAGTVSVALTTLLPSVAQAITFVTSREALGANQGLDWSILGPGGLLPGFPPAFPSFPTPLSVTTESGLKIDFSLPGGRFLRIDQSSTFPPPLGPDFPGAFDDGDALLFTGLNNPGPLILTFDRPIFGVGTQIQSDPSPNAIPAPSGGLLYTGTIEAFDSDNNSLGVFSLEGVSKRETGAGVIFLGVFDENGDIAKIVFNTEEPTSNVAFAINAVSIRTVGVPEPSLIAGMGLMLGLGILRSRAKL